MHSLLKFEILLASEYLKYQNNDAYVFDEIKAALQEWLTPEGEEEDETETPVKETAIPAKSNYSLSDFLGRIARSG